MRHACASACLFPHSQFIRTCGFTVRSPESRVRSLTPKDSDGRFEHTTNDSYVPSRNVGENKRTRCQVRGARCQGISLQSKVQTGGFDRVRSKLLENYVPSRNAYENKDTGRADSDFYSPRNFGPRGAGRACACDGISWEHAENKGGEQGDRCEVRGGRAPDPTSKSKPRGCRRHRRKSTFQAGMFMKTKGRERQRSADESRLLVLEALASVTRK